MGNLGEASTPHQPTTDFALAFKVIVIFLSALVTLVPESYNVSDGSSWEVFSGWPLRYPRNRKSLLKISTTCDSTCTTDSIS